MKKSEVIRIGVMGVVAIVFTIISVLVSGLVGSNTGADRVAALRNEVASREAAEVLKAEEREKQAAAALSAGLDTDRVAKDTEIATVFLRDCMSWDSYSAYDAKRTSVMTGYQLSADSGFMALFLPPRWFYPDEETLAKLPESERAEQMRLAETVATSFGERMSNRFGANPTLSSLTPIVTGISADKTYSYVAVVRWSNMQDNGAQSSYTDVFSYEVTEAGVIGKLDACVLADGG